MKFWTCPYCGSNLDSGERCDCQQEQEKLETRKIDPRQGRKELAYGSDRRKAAVAVWPGTWEH